MRSPDFRVNRLRLGRRTNGNLVRMDPEKRDDLLREVDEELDDTPKGRAIKDTIKSLPVERDRQEGDAPDSEG